jgi:hypothetical protein
MKTLFRVLAAISSFLVLYSTTVPFGILFGKIPEPTAGQIVDLGVMPATTMFLVGTFFIAAAFRAFRVGGIVWSMCAFALLIVAPLVALLIFPYIP